ncbi:MAG: threonine synthase [Acidobacteriota bacterium]|nr:threonine synthase [Blastocatellia bacterium]MDW8238539.1 threonine synthase [Acidobacteriota bacterium]
MSTVTGLTCRSCGRSYPAEPLSICDDCFGPLEVVYDYDAIKRVLSREVIAARGPSMWRYRELLPLDGPPRVGLEAGFTPLLRAHRLGAALGLRRLFIKDDSVSRPSLSFKDRVVAVSLSKALEFGFDTVGCASTGNLANSVAAHAARAGLRAYIFIPADLERAKIIGTTIYGAQVVGIRGNYDDVNRLCSEIADRYHWALVNVNLRPYYAEGSKTFGFEIAEQLGWRAPDAIVVPMAGGALLTKIHKGLKELERIGLIPPCATRLYGAQASGCNPITAAVKNHQSRIQPVKPHTIAKSLAIGNPADGLLAAQAIRESGGWSEEATDEEIRQGIALLSETEGVFAETAGGVTVAVTRKLVAQGLIGPDDLTVIAVTGNGLKTAEVCQINEPRSIDAKLIQFEETFRPERRSTVYAKSAHPSTAQEVHC